MRACFFLQHAGPAGLVQPHRQQNRALQAPGGPQHAGDVPQPASPRLTVPTGLLWGAPCTELGFLGEARVSPRVGSDSLDAGRACTGAGFPGAAQSWWPGDPGRASGPHVWTRQGGERAGYQARDVEAQGTGCPWEWAVLASGPRHGAHLDQMALSPRRDGWSPCCQGSQRRRSGR